MKRILNLAPGIVRNSNIIAKSAKGSWITSVDNTKYLDMTSGIGALSTGHCHPKIVKAVREQSRSLIHAQQNCVYSHLPQVQFFDKIRPHFPKHLDTFFFTNSGSEAVENAIKIARKATRKTNIISFIGGFHGRTLGCMSLSTSKTSCREGYQPLLPGIFHMNYPFENTAQTSIQQLDTLFQRATSPHETAAVIIEPVLGEGGVFKADHNFVHYLKEKCETYNIMLISDEVQTGVGRTGKWWGYQHFNIKPDIVTFGKGIASGFPFAGVVSNKFNFGNIQPNGLGGTYNGNVLATAAANATIDVLNYEKLVKDSNYRGDYIVTKLQSLNHPLIKEIRQYGLMIAIELDMDCNSFRKFVYNAQNYNLLILTTGVNSTVRLLPPLNISFEEIDYFTEQFNLLLQDVFQNDKRPLVVKSV